MKKHLLLIFLIAFGLSSTAQNRFTLEGKLGPAGNFFVTSYDEKAGPPHTAFLNKNFIGSCAGIELAYKLSFRSSIALAYNHTINLKSINFYGPFNSTYVSINDFNIRHIDNFYELLYNRSLFKKVPGFEVQVGLFYLRMKQQEIELENWNNLIVIDERNYKNSELEEGGATFGLKFKIKIDNKFDLGIRSNVYYLISTNSLEAITLTPTLSFRF